MRLGSGLLAAVLLAAACSGSTSSTTHTTEPVAPPSTEASPVATTSPPPVTTTTPPDPTETLQGFVAAVADGEARSAFEMLAPGAVWSFGGFDVRLGEDLSPDMAWLADVIGAPAATGDDLVTALLDYQVTLGTRPEIGACREAASELTCEYTTTDLLTTIIGPTEAGVIAVVAAGGLIERYEFDPSTVRLPTAEPDPFLRWSAIQDPDSARLLSALAWAEVVVPLAEAWEAAGRPDVPSPLEGADPEAVLRAFLDARNDGDWGTMVALMGGKALSDPFGSRDEFEAAQLLERDLEAAECVVTLTDARGTRLACRMAVTDIIVRSAGITATNPNRSTVRVFDGRVTGLPEFLPSSFLAETAIEEWAEANVPAAYREACPEGIAGQSVIDGLECARFIADHREAWEPLVAALDL